MCGRAAGGPKSIQLLQKPGREAALPDVEAVNEPARALDRFEQSLLEAEVLEERHQVGKTLVQYRFLKTGMVRGHLEMKSIPNFAEAMKANKARLID